jgi:hypothetical protein
VPNKKTLEHRLLEAELEDIESKEQPLDYMLRIMHSRTADPPRRDAMARSAAQYCHPTLQAVAHKLHRLLFTRRLAAAPLNHPSASKGRSRVFAAGSRRAIAGLLEFRSR